MNKLTAFCFATALFLIVSIANPKNQTFVAASANSDQDYLLTSASTNIVSVDADSAMEQKHTPIVGVAAENTDNSTEIEQYLEKANEFKLPTELSNEVECLAKNIYFEARGEPELGQRAVAHVVLNRVSHARFPNSICGVVQQGGYKKRYRCQFSWWCDGRSDQPKNSNSWKKSVWLAIEISNGNSIDPTDGALWYHADFVNPYWNQALLKGPDIGVHIFYKIPA